jgi:hypothetical protein
MNVWSTAWRRAVVALLLVAIVAGCTTTRTIAVDSLGDVVPEDRVRITTTDGRILAFTVTGVEPDAVVGEDIRVERHEVAALEVTNFSPARTAGLVGLTAFGVAMLVVIPVVAAGLALGATL